MLGDDKTCVFGVASPVRSFRKKLSSSVLSSLSSQRRGWPVSTAARKFLEVPNLEGCTGKAEGRYEVFSYYFPYHKQEGQLPWGLHKDW